MSNPSEILRNFFPLIENRVVLELTRGSLLKDEIADQFQNFFNHLLQTVETGDPTWFDPLLEEWANSLTQSDLEDERIIINDFITQLVSIINQTIVEYLYLYLSILIRLQRIGR